MRFSSSIESCRVKDPLLAIVIGAEGLAGAEQRLGKLKHGQSRSSGHGCQKRGTFMDGVVWTIARHGDHKTQPLDNTHYVTTICDTLLLGSASHVREAQPGLSWPLEVVVGCNLVVPRSRSPLRSSEQLCSPSFLSLDDRFFVLCGFTPRRLQLQDCPRATHSCQVTMF